MRGDDEALVREAIASKRGTAFDPRVLRFTGTALERVELDDGRVFVVKHLDPEGDWLARATGGIGRAQRLWSSGLLERLRPVVDHGVVGIIRLRDGDAIVMRDLSGALVAPEAHIDREGVEELLVRMAAFHAFAETLDAPGLCSIAQRCGFTNPAFHRDDRGPSPLARDGEAPAMITDAVAHLAGRAGGPAGRALLGYFDDLPAMVREIGSRTPRAALLHGDAKPENLGCSSGRLVAVDWGELTGRGPAEFDVVRFAFAASGFHAPLAPAEILEVYDRHALRPLDPDLVRLAMLATMATNGVGLLARITRYEDPELKQRAKDCLAAGIDALRRAYADLG